jgi:hypothetical protein
MDLLMFDLIYSSSLLACLYSTPFNHLTPYSPTTNLPETLASSLTSSG